MSSELYIQGFSSRGRDGLDVHEVLTLFGVEANDGDQKFLPLVYDAENTCELTVAKQDGKAISITVLRPCGHEEFWGDVFRLLERGPYVAFMPGSPLVQVNVHVKNGVPDDMTEALGAPVTARTSSELARLLLSSST